MSLPRPPTTWSDLPGVPPEIHPSATQSLLTVTMWPMDGTKQGNQSVGCLLFIPFMAGCLIVQY